MMVLWDPMHTMPPFRRPSCIAAEVAFNCDVAIAMLLTSP
jgi:hypothetical protein